MPPLAIGVMLRIFGYRFFDLTLEGSFLMGLIGGRMVGLLGGSLISLLAFGFHEWLSSPMAALVGLLAGMIREVIPEKEDVWHFGPFLFLNIPQWLWRLVRYGKGNWAMLPLFACAACEVGLDRAGRRVPSHWLFSIHPEQLGLYGSGGAFLGDVRGHGRQDLEQHAHRDEPRAEPAALAQGAHGRA